MNQKELIEKAIFARTNSYSPYSRYKVGAALLTKGNYIYTGTNIENASYGLTICAERVAIFNALVNGKSGEEFIALAVVTEDGGTSCGACRQVLAEFNVDMMVYFCKIENDVLVSIEEMTVTEMLPKMFRL